MKLKVLILSLLTLIGVGSASAAGKGDIFENDFLKLMFNAVTEAALFSNAGTLTNLHISLHTADPGDAGNQTTSEISYTPYARIAVARTTGGWTVTGASVSPVANIDFAAMTSGTGGLVTHTCIGTAATGTGKILYCGNVDPDINVTAGVTPRLTTATTVTED